MSTKVIVVGAGYAGLTIAAFLKRLKRSSLEVKIVERLTRNAWLESRRLPVGLWAPACDALTKVGVNVQKLNPIQMPGGCYTNASGQVLAEAPPSSLERTPLRFFERSGAVLDAIIAAQNLKVDYGCETHQIGQPAAKSKSPSPRARLKLTTPDQGGKLYEADLVIFASGPSGYDHSIAGAPFGSSLIHPLLGTSIAPPLPRGYVVYRGVSNVPLRPVFLATAFQTWGSGVRFAAVPLPEGRSAWFATFAHGHPFAKLEEHVAGMIQTGSQMESIVASLRTALTGWHDPINELLEGTSALSVEEGVASRFPWRAAARGEGRNLRLGDCAFTYDPILAIGAGEAIMDATLLASVLEERLDRPNPHLDDLYIDQVRGVMASVRVTRCRTLTALSNASQLFGQTRWCRLRDLALLPLPTFVKHGLFGWSIGKLGS